MPSEIKVKLTKKRVASLAVAIMLLLTVGTVVAQSSLSSVVISGGPYPGAPTYTVFTESGMYYAKNGNGAIVWSSSNAATLIQNAVSSLTSGGRLLFKSGTYLLTTTITIPNGGITFAGEDMGTVYITTATEGLTMFSIAGSYSMVNFEYLYLWHQGTTGKVIYAPYGLRVNYFDHLQIIGDVDFRGTLIHINGNGTNTYENHFTHCNFVQAQYHINYTGGAEIYVSGCKFGTPQAQGKGYVRITDSGWVNVVGNGFEGTTLQLIALSDTEVHSNWFSDPSDIGIYLWECHRGSVSGITVNGLYPNAGTRAGVWATGSTGTTDGMTFSDISVVAGAGETGILFDAGAVDNILLNIDTKSCTDTGISITDTSSNRLSLSWNKALWVDNYQGRLSQSGSALVSGGTATVTLSALGGNVPATIIITSRVAGVTAQCTARNAYNFTITATGDGYCDYYAEYWP